MNKLKIGGKNRPFSFTADAFEEFSDKYDIPLAELGTAFSRIRIGQFYDLAFLGLSEGARVSNLTVDFDRDVVKKWMNGKLSEVMGEVITFAAKDLGMIFGTDVEVEEKPGNVKEIAKAKQ